MKKTKHTKANTKREKLKLKKELFIFCFEEKKVNKKKLICCYAPILFVGLQSVLFHESTHRYRRRLLSVLFFYMILFWIMYLLLLLSKKKNPNQINYMIIWKNQCVNCGAKSIFRFFNGKWDCEIVVCLLSIHLCDITKDLENMLVQTIFSSNANHIICWQQIAVKLWSGTVWNVKK